MLGVLGKERRSAWRESSAGRGQGRCRSQQPPCLGDVCGVFKVLNGFEVLFRVLWEAVEDFEK